MKEMNNIAAVLTIGTEVVEGQILNRNAQWISQKLQDLGYNTTTHLSVLDSEKAILSALDFLHSAHALIVITGGLGPTSDDLTREVVSRWAGKPLKWNEASWVRIVERLTSLQVMIAEANRKQCFFPVESKIFENNKGTADGFCLTKDSIELIVLPGPPKEIEAIWNKEVEPLLVQKNLTLNKDELLIWGCLGLSESRLSEIVDEVLKDKEVRYGFRVSMPYTEVKVWISKNKTQRTFIDQMEKTISPWIYYKGLNRLTDEFNLLAQNKSIICVDFCTKGVFAKRLSSLSLAKVKVITDFNQTVYSHKELKSELVFLSKLLEGSIFGIAMNEMTGEVYFGLLENQIYKERTCKLIYKGSHPETPIRNQMAIVEQALKNYCEILNSHT